jgi:hypothetical protein
VLKLGIKFFNNPKAITLKFKTSGIMKFSKSIKNITTKIKLKIDKKIIEDKLSEVK